MHAMTAQYDPQYLITQVIKHGANMSKWAVTKSPALSSACREGGSVWWLVNSSSGGGGLCRLAGWSYRVHYILSMEYTLYVPSTDHFAKKDGTDQCLPRQKLFDG